ncbi:MAG TPA: hypothetical protein VJB10_01015 [Candidatus Peribacteraceae bacterium]|nr:hypothetical protein [Candidatus Peribacteraceae bacterium]
MRSTYIPFPSGFRDEDLPSPDDVEHLGTLIGHPLPAERQAIREEYAFLRRAFDAAAPSVLKRHLGKELNRQLVLRRMHLREWLDKNSV